MTEKERLRDLFAVYDFRWAGTAGRPAGIFWLDGRCVMAGHGSPLEERLIEQGAILVGTLRFDPDPLEASHPGHAVDRMTTGAAVALSQISGN